MPELAISVVLADVADTARVSANQPDLVRFGPSLSRVSASCGKKKKKLGAAPTREQ